MKKQIVLINFFILVISMNMVFSQEITYDKIYLKNKSILEGNIIQVTPQNIEINPKGNKPFIVIPRDSVNVLIYSDNTVITFEGLTNKKKSENINDLINAELSKKW